MCKKIKYIFILLSLFLFTPMISNASGYTINDLIENGKSIDKKEVTITGEAIGEALKRGDHSWININDTTGAMGIYMNKEDANKVKIYGGYKAKGDTIKVVGEFRRACSEHGGDMDIHAKEVTIIKNGYKISRPTTHIAKDLTAAILSVVTICIGYILYITVRKKI